MASLGCFESFPGTVIILPATDTTPFQQWTIGEQLSEDMHQQTKSAVEKGMGPSYAAAKFYCHSIDRDEKAMMRIHLQVPNRVQGTEVAPKLLALHEGKQDKDGVISGGFVNYLTGRLCQANPSSRKAYGLSVMTLATSSVFSFGLYHKLLQCGIDLYPPHLHKIIYDDQTSTMHLGGRRGALKADPDEESTEGNYMSFGLLKLSQNVDWTRDLSVWEWCRIDGEAAWEKSHQCMPTRCP
ncbi:hypothetical protein N7471_009719 [Penicillium samsonianum]|uniref:uncharacterized protein n=1 Tax=Penicillium samsonianum TaxID=1882272 RepID=UPI002547FCA2|nr:uncharacterized protein N7471_009719 [Penicillium samsonianum]KAJ6128502.1 hypothetical protein N7471_009719 [Penicillium samsonianum]